jgi:hypothetical protein
MKDEKIEIFIVMIIWSSNVFYFPLTLLTLIKRAAFAEEHPLSASNLARSFSASVLNTSLSIAQLESTFSE